MTTDVESKMVSRRRLLPLLGLAAEPPTRAGPAFCPAPVHAVLRGSVDGCCAVHATMVSNHMHDRNGIFIAPTLPG